MNTRQAVIRLSERQQEVRAETPPDPPPRATPKTGALDQMAKTRPDQAHRLAVLLHRRGQPDLAEAAWRQVVFHHPLHAGAQAALAQIETRRGESHLAAARAGLATALAGPQNHEDGKRPLQPASRE